MSRETLIVALQADDWPTIQRLGWGEVLRDLDSFFPGEFGPKEALPYARLLGEHPPTVVHQAVVGAATFRKWRPEPAELATSVANAAKPKPFTVAASRRPDLQPLVLATVRDRLSRGSIECGCYRTASKSMQPDGVIVCGECGGLDPGQVDVALETA